MLVIYLPILVVVVVCLLLVGKKFNLSEFKLKIPWHSFSFVYHEEEKEKIKKTSHFTTKIDEVDSNAVAQVQCKQSELEEVLNDVNNAKPDHRVDVMESYEGKRVSWDLFLEYSRRDAEEIDLRHIRCKADPDGFEGVRFSVSVKDYPEIKSAESYAKLRVHGTILAVNYFEVELSEVQLNFD